MWSVYIVLQSTLSEVLRPSLLPISQSLSTHSAYSWNVIGWPPLQSLATPFPLSSISLGLVAWTPFRYLIQHPVCDAFLDAPNAKTTLYKLSLYNFTLNDNFKWPPPDTFIYGPWYQWTSITQSNTHLSISIAGSQYYRLSPEITGPVDAGYPRPTTKWGFDFPINSTFGDMFTSPITRRMYLFTGNQFYRYSDVTLGVRLTSILCTYYVNLVSNYFRLRPFWRYILLSPLFLFAQYCNKYCYYYHLHPSTLLLLLLSLLLPLIITTTIIITFSITTTI